MKTVVASKILLSLAFAISLSASFNAERFKSVFVAWPSGDHSGLSCRMATWDSAHYLRLSLDGYQKDSPSCAFYPYWPASVRAVCRLGFTDPLGASLLLANLFSAAALCIFYTLAVKQAGERSGERSLVLLLSFPGALFFSFPYTE